MKFGLRRSSRQKPSQRPSYLLSTELAFDGLGLIFANRATATILALAKSERVSATLDGKPVTLRHLLGVVKPFMGRFVALGLPFGIIFAVLFGVMFAVSFAAAFKAHRRESIHIPAWFGASFCALLVAMDFALTFVTSALAYTARSARRALRIGFVMIRQTWPRCALYVLCPPLALSIMSFVFPVSISGVRFALNVVLVLAALLAKSAIAAFYLRERGSYSGDGATYIPAGDEPPGSVPLTTPIDHRRSR